MAAARGLASGSRMIATKAASRRISDQMTKRIIKGSKYGPARPPGGITSRPPGGITSRPPASVVDKIKDEFRIWNGRMNTIPEEQRPVVQSMLDQVGEAMASKTPPKWIDDAMGYFLKKTGG